MKVFTDRVAVVTGAGSGIGRATSEALARKGCHVALADIDDDGAEGTAEVIRRIGRTASTHHVDVADAGQVAELAEQVEKVHGACHILINNAGVTSAGAFEDESLDDLRWIVDINVWGVVNGCRAFLPLLRRADEAHIVNLSSMVGLLGLPHNASYSLTKGAVRSFTEALRSELVATPIGVTAVFPGAIRTNITNAARGGEAAPAGGDGSVSLGAGDDAPALGGGPANRPGDRAQPGSRRRRARRPHGRPGQSDDAGSVRADRTGNGSTRRVAT